MLEDKIAEAVYRKDYDVLETLLNGDNVDAVDEDGRTALMHAVLAEDAAPQMVAFLIKRGADVHAADGDQGWTAIHFAARDQRVDIVEVLLRHGADVDCVDSFGNTPLWRCVMNATPNIAIIKALLANGADANKKNVHGVSALDTARKMGKDELVALLELAG